MKYLLEKARGTGSYHAPYGIDHSAKNQTQQDIFLLEEKQRLDECIYCYFRRRICIIPILDIRWLFCEAANQGLVNAREANRAISSDTTQGLGEKEDDGNGN